MGKQKKIKIDAIRTLRNELLKDTDSILKYYLNKEEFCYPFDEKDISECEFEQLPPSTIDRMMAVINNSIESNADFRDADYRCGKILYEHYKFLTPRQASDIEFWNYLHHFDLYKYIHKRWSEVDNPTRGTQETYINRHWLMHLSSQKHLVNFPLSGLWWSFFLTVDEERDDPYELTKLYFENNRIRTVTFGGSSFIRHKQASIGILEFFKKNNEKIKIADETGNMVAKFINRLGGLKPLGYFEKEWFIEKLEKEFLQRNINTDGSKKEDISTNETQEKDNVIKYFNLYSEGSYCMTNNAKEDAIYSLPIKDSDQNGYLMQCYDTGRINKVKISFLLNRKSGKHYLNGLNQDGKIKLLQIIPRDEIIGIKFSEQNIKKFKAHLTENIPSREQLHLKGYKMIYSDFKEIDYEILSIDVHNDIRRLVFRSFTANGKPVNNDYYEHEWSVIKRHTLGQPEDQSIMKHENSGLQESKMPKELSNNRVGINNIAKVKFLNNDRILKVKLIDHTTKEDKFIDGVQKISIKKPLAAAIIDKTIGDRVKVGDTDNEVEIIEVY